MTKRCTICARKLDKNGDCQNKKCPRYTLAQIRKAAEAERAAGKEGNK